MPTLCLCDYIAATPSSFSSVSPSHFSMQAGEGGQWYTEDSALAHTQNKATKRVMEASTPPSASQPAPQ